MVILCILIPVLICSGILAYRKKRKLKETSTHTKEGGTISSSGTSKANNHAETTDTQTAEEKYADNHNMWICPYCESLNPFPPGMKKRKKKETSPVPVEKKSSPGLRGDLVKKINADSEPIPEPELYCIVCGKHS